MSYTSDYEQTLLILDIIEKSLLQNFRVLREIQQRMKKEHEQRLWEIQQDGNGDSS